MYVCMCMCVLTYVRTYIGTMCLCMYVNIY